jgi:tetratricopeptide (TPR) repeat protein
MTRERKFPATRRLLPVCVAAMLFGCVTSDMHKGTVALGLGDYGLAVIFFSKVLEKDPAHFGARLGMGKALLQRAVDIGDDSVSWPLALMHLEAARTLGSTPDINRLLSQAWTERAHGLLSRGDTLEAIEALTKAIACDPAGSEPLNLAGIIYYRIGKSEKAKALFERAGLTDTAAASPLFNLGMVHWDRGAHDTAYGLWLKAIKKAPDDEVILDWLAAAEKRIRRGSLGAEKGQR